MPGYYQISHRFQDTMFGRMESICGDNPHKMPDASLVLHLATDEYVTLRAKLCLNCHNIFVPTTYTMITGRFNPKDYRVWCVLNR